jgi:hypothetical protein
MVKYAKGWSLAPKEPTMVERIQQTSGPEDDLILKQIAEEHVLRIGQVVADKSYESVPAPQQAPEASAAQQAPRKSISVPKPPAETDTPRKPEAAGDSSLRSLAEEILSQQMAEEETQEDTEEKVVSHVVEGQVIAERDEPARPASPAPTAHPRKGVARIHLPRQSSRLPSILVQSIIILLGLAAAVMIAYLMGVLNF